MTYNQRRPTLCASWNRRCNAAATSVAVGWGIQRCERRTNRPWPELRLARLAIRVHPFEAVESLMDGGPPCRNCLREERNSTPGTAEHDAADSGGVPTKSTSSSGSSTNHSAVPNEPQFRPDNPRVSCWRKHAPKTGFSGNCGLPQWTSLRPAFVYALGHNPGDRHPGTRAGECHQNIATIVPRPAWGPGCQQGTKVPELATHVQRRAIAPHSQTHDADPKVEPESSAVFGDSTPLRHSPLRIHTPLLRLNAETTAHS